MLCEPSCLIRSAKWKREIYRRKENREQMLLVLLFCLFNSLFCAFLFYQHDIYWPFNQAPCLQQVCSCYRRMCVLYPCPFSMWLKSAFASGIPHSLWTVSGPGFISVAFLCPLGMSSPVKYHSVCSEAFPDSLSCTLLAPLLFLMFLSL